LLRSAGVEFGFEIKTVGNGKRDRDRERDAFVSSRLKEKFCTNDDGEMKVLKTEMNWT
jgi:hypothetical protein